MRSHKVQLRTYLLSIKALTEELLQTAIAVLWEYPRSLDNSK